MPAIVAASWRAERASRSSGCLVAFGRSRNAVVSASRARASENGFDHSETAASKAWATSSAPVSAVSSVPIEAGNEGSRSAQSGTSSREAISSARPSSPRTRAVHEASPPLPLVVGTATNPALDRSRSSTSGVIDSSGSSGQAYRTQAAFAASIVRPPPSATIQSGW